MKKSILFITLLVLANTLIAQDNIILRTGDEIKAKVLEVGIADVKYHRNDNPTGPLYVIAKREVFMIKYENGTKDVFGTAQQTSPNNDKCPMTKDDKTAGGDYKKLHHLAVKRIAGGAVMVGAGAPVLLSGLVMSAIGVSSGGFPFSGNGGNNAPLIVTGGIFTAAGIVLEVLGGLSIKKGIQLRKAANQVKASVGFAPIVNPTLDRYNSAMFQNKAGVTFTF